MEVEKLCAKRKQNVSLIKGGAFLSLRQESWLSNRFQSTKREIHRIATIWLLRCPRLLAKSRTQRMGVRMKRRQVGPERRSWQRLPLAIPVFVHGTDERGQRFVEFATAMNISAGGAQLAIRRHLAPTSRISLEIPCSVGPYKTVSTQVRSNLSAKIMSKIQAENGEPYHLHGLKFSRPLIVKRTQRVRQRKRPSLK